MLGLKRKATKVARRAGLVTAGGLMSAVGLGFLTAAAWMSLSALIGAHMTAFVIGAAYLGMGLLIFGLTMDGADDLPEHPTHAAPAPADGPPIVQAFLHGLQAGSQASARHRHLAPTEPYPR